MLIRSAIINILKEKSQFGLFKLGLEEPVKDLQELALL